jgi:hypothetical protein
METARGELFLSELYQFLLIDNLQVKGAGGNGGKEKCKESAY